MDQSFENEKKLSKNACDVFLKKVKMKFKFCLKEIQVFKQIYIYNKMMQKE
jgi:hypothetical protein